MTSALPVALITGAARRIGRAIALDLAGHGHPVVIHCNRSREEGDELCAEILRGGGKASVVTADLTQVDQLDDMVAQAASAFGPLGILVNNASVFQEDTAQDFSWDVWDQHFAIHIKAPVQLARLFAAQVPPESEGLVVNVVDQRVWRPTPRFFSYSLSKAALWAATQTLAQALAPNIRVNAIGPGPTLPNSRQSEADFSAQIAGLMLERGPDLSEFGATIRYLLAARSVTGQMIALDGGQHLAWQTPDIAGIAE
jgi:NAD(P)-dependent dehydrogenase (short-subunit alcohol dehydrogenase family)